MLRIKFVFSSVAMATALITVMPIASAHAHALALANSEEQILRELLNTTIECSVFYQILGDYAQSANTESGEDLAKNFNKTANHLISRANIINTMLGYKEEALMARYELALKSMLAVVDYKRGNYPILINKYTAICKSLAIEYEKQGL